MTIRRLVLVWMLLANTVRVEAWSSPSKRKVDQPSTSVFKSSNRRQFLHNLLVVVGTTTAVPDIASAGAVGEQINKAVTQSDLGLSVRRSVVGGAQTMDKLDGQWERLSDRFGLGSERSKRDSLSPPKVIPNPKPLDSALASKILDITDATFAQLTNTRSADLSKRIQNVAATVQPSFARSGLSLAAMESPSKPSTGEEFNFASYIHFKAYSDVLIERKIDFPGFKKDFERQVGQKLVALFLPSSSVESSSSSGSEIQERRQVMLKEALEKINGVCEALLAKGLVAQIDQAALDAEKVADWSEDLSTLTWSIALDGDVTMKSQILLQEQGFRLYPNYGRYAIQSILQSVEGQRVSTDDYYMDPDYNSNPDMFRVQEILINIEIESI
jgi:hypothetical protein